MRISIDTSSQVPVFAQLVQRIRESVQEGLLKPGTALPPIRQLAADLQINPNTVAKAYGLLERDAIIETRGRLGSVVRSDARRATRVDLPGEASATLARAVAELRGKGLTDSEIRIAFTNVMRE
jgi:GntR family transcriptional regulator